MRVLTHNMLICVVKGCTDNFPLLLKADKIEQTEDFDSEEVFNPDFVRSLLTKIDYNAFLFILNHLNLPHSFPNSMEQLDLHNIQLLKDLHRLLLDTHVSEGALKCSKCERVYPISQGIPNMLLREDEV